MPSLRGTAIAEVKEGFAAGRLQWSRECVDDLREPWGDVGAGVLQEGQEVEGALEEGEDPWRGESDEEASEQEEEDIEAELGDGAQSTLVSKKDEVEVVAEPEDTAEEVAEAKRFAERQQVLDSLAQLATKSNLVQLQWHVHREKKKLEKLHGLGTADPSASAVLRRFLRTKLEAEAQKMKEVREETRRRKAEAQEVKLAETKAKQKAEKDRLKALAALEKTFSAATLGQGQKKGGGKAYITARVQALNRLRLRAPPLPSPFADEFDDFAKRYSESVGKKFGEAVGFYLIGKITAIMEELGDYLLPAKAEASSSKKPKLTAGGEKAGDAQAFLTFMRKASKALPKCASEVTV